MARQFRIWSVLSRVKEEALEHALAGAEQATHEVYMTANYETRAGLERLLQSAKELGKVWEEIAVELEKELGKVWEEIAVELEKELK